MIYIKSETMISVKISEGKRQFKSMFVALKIGQRQQMNSGSKRGLTEDELILKSSF